MRITLNEELNRIRFLFNAKSGNKMTISEIDKTYLTEQGTGARIIRNLDENPFFLTPVNGSATDLMLQHRSDKSYIFAGVPANIIAPNDQSLNGNLFLKIGQTGSGNNQAINNFINYLTSLLTSEAFQQSNLMMNNQPLPSNLSNNLGILYDNLAKGPIIRALQNQPFNLQQGIIPPNFNFGLFLSGLTANGAPLNQANPNLAQNVQTLRNAINTSKAGINQFKLFITRAPNAPNFRNPPPQPITGFAVPSMFSGSQLGGVLAQLDTIGVGGTNDSVAITITFRFNGFISSSSISSNNISIDATKALSKAFYRLIENNRQQGQGRGGASSGPINIPTLDDLLTDQTFIRITSNWGDYNDYIRSLSIVSININVTTPFPNLIQTTPNITIVQELPNPFG